MECGAAEQTKPPPVKAERPAQLERDNRREGLAGLALNILFLRGSSLGHGNVHPLLAIGFPHLLDELALCQSEPFGFGGNGFSRRGKHLGM